MNATSRQLVLLIVTAITVSAQTSCARGLPRSAESTILRCLHAKKIVQTRETRQRSLREFDYFGISLTVEVDWSFEAWYHRAIVLRKPRSDRDWSKAELFGSEDLSTSQVFDLPDDAFLRRLHREPCE